MSAPLDPVGAGHNRSGAASNPDGASNADALALARGYIHCLRDEFVQVRRQDGTLVGVIPMIKEDAALVYTKDGRTCDVMTGIIRGVLVPDDVDPRSLYNFTPRDGVKLDPVQKADGSLEVEDAP